MTTLTTAELLKVLQTALEAFRDEVEPDILVTKVLALTTTAQNPGLQQVDISTHVKGLSTSSASRHVQDWSDLDKNKRPGMDFIQQRPDPDYRRRNVLFLTPRGQQFVESLTARVNKALAPPAARAGKH